MALREDRNIPHDGWETRFSIAAATAEGKVVCYSTAGSGAATSDSRPLAAVQANPSGYKPLGVLMQPVVDIDQTLYHRNWHKTEAVINEPVGLAKAGWIMTDNIQGTPTVGGTAYLGSSGAFCVTPSATGGLVANPIVGEFETQKDENGYASVRIDIPTKIS